MAEEQALTAGNVLARLAALSTPVKLAIGGAVVAVLGLVVLLLVRSGSTPDYKVLFSNLADKDGGAIVAALSQMNVPYKMNEGGTAILVPGATVYETRLKLAAQGLPKGAGVGFELIENQKLGTSQFLEQVNYQRALEGELARSIQSIDAIREARVHLAIPKPSVFLRDDQKPSASVVITLYPGRQLEPAQSQAVMHLVSSSVPELSPRAVSLVDQSGRLLSRTGEGAEAEAGLDPTQLAYLQKVENSYIKRIQAILVPIVGEGNVHAQVSAQLDFTRIEETSEVFRPNPSPDETSIRSQQNIETITASAISAGVPGALTNQPPGTAEAPINAPTVGPGAGPQTDTHRESTVNYEVDKTVRHTKPPVGTVRKLNAAVVVNYKRIVENGKTVRQEPYNAAELAQMEALVRQAIGLDPARGDALNLVSAGLSVPTKLEPEEDERLPWWMRQATVQLIKDIGKALLIATLLLYLLYILGRPAKKPAKAEALDQGVGSEPALAEGAVAVGGAGIGSLAGVSIFDHLDRGQVYSRDPEDDSEPPYDRNREGGLDEALNALYAEERERLRIKLEAERRQLAAEQAAEAARQAEAERQRQQLQSQAAEALAQAQQQAEDEKQQALEQLAGRLRSEAEMDQQALQLTREQALEEARKLLEQEQLLAEQNAQQNALAEALANLPEEGITEEYLASLSPEMRELLLEKIRAGELQMAEPPLTLEQKRERFEKNMQFARKLLENNPGLLANVFNGWLTRAEEQSISPPKRPPK